MRRGSVPSTTSNALGHFSMSPQANIPRSKFNRSHGYKTTFDVGELVPILVDEMLPGDTFNCRLSAFVRMSTPIVPIMDNLFLETFFFAVPNRLLWDNWEKFLGFNTSAGIQTTDYVLPQINLGAMESVAEGSLGDYMGIPTQINDIFFSALPFRAYNKIWNDWFRDQNLQAEVTVPTGDGPDSLSTYTLLRRNKRYDYFTSALPWPQKGPDQLIPSSFASDAPVVSSGVAPEFKNVNDPSVFKLFTSGTGLSITALPSAAGDVIFESPTGLEVDIAANASLGTINELREAFQIQKFYERAARGGTRYTEVIKAFFNVDSPDMRLQRAEYIGGGSTPILINPVAQTTQNNTPTNTNGLGVLGAYGVAAVNKHGFTYSATEHMTIIGLVSVRADLNYQQGLERMWNRETKFDFYWPVFSHLGEQAILNKEIYTQGTSDDLGVFGYQERYAEYRYKPSQITGLFRSNATGSLDIWHLAQDFGSLPTLNTTFIQENPPMERVEAVSTEPDFIFDGFFSYICARPMPVYAVPGLVDHF